MCPLQLRALLAMLLLLGAAAARPSCSSRPPIDLDFGQRGVLWDFAAAPCAGREPEFTFAMAALGVFEFGVAEQAFAFQAIWQSGGQGADEHLRAYDEMVGARPTAGRLDAGLISAARRLFPPGQEPDPQGYGAALAELVGAGAPLELSVQLGFVLLGNARSEYVGYDYAGEVAGRVARITEEALAASNGANAAALHLCMHDYMGHARLAPGELVRRARRLARHGSLRTADRIHAATEQNLESLAAAEGGALGCYAPLVAANAGHSSEFLHYAEVARGRWVRAAAQRRAAIGRAGDPGGMDLFVKFRLAVVSAREARPRPRPRPPRRTLSCEPPLLLLLLLRVAEAFSLGALGVRRADLPAPAWPPPLHAVPASLLEEVGAGCGARLVGNCVWSQEAAGAVAQACALLSLEPGADAAPPACGPVDSVEAAAARLAALAGAVLAAARGEDLARRTARLVPPSPSLPLPDPEQELLRRAAAEEAAAGYVPCEPPRVPLAPSNELLGAALLEGRRYREALDAFSRALRTLPDRPNSLVGAARAAAALGRPGRAREYYAAAFGVLRRADLGHPLRQEARTGAKLSRAELGEEEEAEANGGAGAEFRLGPAAALTACFLSVAFFLAAARRIQRPEPAAGGGEYAPAPVAPAPAAGRRSPPISSIPAGAGGARREAEGRRGYAAPPDSPRAQSLDFGGAAPEL
eukprot:tig00001042_g6580.t1